MGCGENFWYFDGSLNTPSVCGVDAFECDPCELTRLRRIAAEHEAIEAKVAELEDSLVIASHCMTNEEYSNYCVECEAVWPCREFQCAESNRRARQGETK